MKIVVTGSLGHISQPLTKELVQKGHDVTVISSNEERKNAIETLGAKAAIGSMHDVAFLTLTFAGADVVYCMVPPGNFLDSNLELTTHYTEIADNYVQALQHSEVKQVVQLSSIGAHTDKGVGILRYAHDIEQILNQLPINVSIKFIRAVGIFYNMLAFIPTIKNANAIFQNYGGGEKEPWVSALDIAAVIAEEIESPFGGREIRYVASEEMAPNEIVRILGTAIGKPDLQWKVIPDEQMKSALIDSGISHGIATGLVEMNAGRRNGVLYEDYYRNRPKLGKVKLSDYAQEFAAAYFRNQSI